MEQSRHDFKDFEISLKFTGRHGFVLERNFTSLGVKEWTLFLKVLEDTFEEEEEEELEGMEDEQLQQRRKEEETHALVLAMKREWDVWLSNLPFPPGLNQFEPGFYTMTSSSLNPNVNKGVDFGHLSRDSYELLDFVSAPKVLLMSSTTVCLNIQFQVIKLTLTSPGSVELTELPNSLVSSFGQGRLSKKKS